MIDPIKAAADWLSNESPEKWGFNENMLLDVVEAAEALQDDVAALTEANTKAIAAISEEARKRGAAEAERDMLRRLVRKIRLAADEWLISRHVGCHDFEQEKGDALWKEIRRASGMIAPIETSAALNTQEEADAPQE